MKNIKTGDWVAFMSDGVLTIGLVLYTNEDTTIITHCGEVNVNSIREVRAGKS